MGHTALRHRLDGPRLARFRGPGDHAWSALGCRRLIRPDHPRRAGGHRTAGWPARIQSHPTRVARLLGPTDPSAVQAVQGCGSSQLAAAGAEIDRLMNVCGAVETAPSHDRDKALRSTAAPWERVPLRGGVGPPRSVCPSFHRTRPSANTTATACDHRLFARLRASLSATSNQPCSRCRRRTDVFGYAPTTGL